MHALDRRRMCFGVNRLCRCVCLYVCIWQLEIVLCSPIWRWVELLMSWRRSWKKSMAGILCRFSSCICVHNYMNEWWVAESACVPSKVCLCASLKTRSSKAKANQFRFYFRFNIPKIQTEFDADLSTSNWILSPLVHHLNANNRR